MVWMYEEHRLTVESLQGYRRYVMGTPQHLEKLQVLMPQPGDLKARWPNRDAAEELVALSMSTLGPRFVQDRQEGWSFSQARDQWKSRKREARFGGALQIVDSLVRKDRAVHIFRLDDGRRRMRTSGKVGSDIEEDAQNDLGEEVIRPYTQREKEKMKTSDSCGYHDPAQFVDMKLLVENQPKGPEEQLLGRRSRLLSSLSTTNSEVVRSGLSEGVLKAARDSEFEKMDYGDDCESEGDSSLERPVLVAARRLLRKAREAPH